MKRFMMVFIAFVFLMACAGCGAEESVSETSAQQQNELAALAIGAENYEEVETAIQWTEVDGLDENYGYVVSDADCDALDLDISLYAHQTSYVDEAAVENGRIPLILEGIDGTELKKFWVKAPENDMETINAFSFGEDDVWLVRQYRTIVDEETGEWTAEFVLEHWDGEENLLQSIPLDETYGVGADGILYTGLYRSTDGTLLLHHSYGLYWLDENGKVLHTLEFEEDEYSTCFDRDGELYLLGNNYSTIYPIDWESCTVQDALLSVGYDEFIVPGSGEYDFLVYNSKYLRGVSIQREEIQTLLKWSECNISDPRGAVYVDKDTILALVNSMSAVDNVYLALQKTPVSEIPEKTTVNLAIGISPNLKGFAWQDCTGNLDDFVAEYNLKTNYEIEVTIFYDAEELNLLMLSDDPPDMICWGNMDMTRPTLQNSYIRNGYLKPINELMAGEENMPLDSFFPQIVEMATVEDGNIYAMPTAQMLYSYMGRQDLVGTEQGWSYEEFFSAIESRPEEMTACSWDAENALSMCIRYNMGDFIDMDTGSCDFSGETFAELLRVCKENFPIAWEDIVYFDDGFSAAMAGDIMLTALYVHNLPTLAEEYQSYLDAGLVAVGFPGVGGNGAVLKTGYAYSITTNGDQTEAAWDFVKQFYGYDYQSSFYGGSTTVRTDCLESYSQWWSASFGADYLDESFYAAMDLYLGAAVADPVDAEILDIVIEECGAYFDGSKTAAEIGSILDSRIKIYLSEQMG